jgi:hypothetical protein
VTRNQTTLCVESNITQLNASLLKLATLEAAIGHDLHFKSNLNSSPFPSLKPKSCRIGDGGAKKHAPTVPLSYPSFS